MLSQSPAKGVSNFSGGEGSTSRGVKRGRRRRAATPCATTAPAPASALGYCLAALVLYAAGGETSALANAYLIGGGGSSTPACFLHPSAASAVSATAASVRIKTGPGRGDRGAVALPELVVGAAAPRDCGENNGGFTRDRRRARTRLEAWGNWGSGGPEREAAAVQGRRFRHGEAAGAGSRGRGEAGALRMNSVGAQAGVGNDGGAGGIPAATGTMKAATAGDGGTATDAGAAAVATEPPNLASLKLAELKAMYRERGGKPGNLRKAELVDRLRESTQQQQQPQQPPPPRPPQPMKTGGDALSLADAAAASPALKFTEHSAGTAERAAAPLESLPQGAPDTATGQPPPPPQEAGKGIAGAPSLFSVLSGGRAAVGTPEDGNLSADDTSALHSAAAITEQEPGEAAWVPPGDLLSSGPSAVVAAAKARGAAAAAASSRATAAGRFRALSEARRHTEAVRKRAMDKNNRLLAAASESAGHQHQEVEFGASTTPPPDNINGGGGGTGVTEGVPGARSLEGLRNVAPGRAPGMAPGAAAVAAVAAAEAARAGAAAANQSTAEKGPVGRRGAGAAPGAEAAPRVGGQGGPGDGRAWSVLAEKPVVRRSAGQARQRRLPPMPNPWSRGGVGGPAEGMAEEGDVVDGFLADTMMQTSNEREASGDPLFDRESRFGALPKGAPMSLTFLGTASCIPSTSRGVSCTVLRNEGDLWLFDVGEGTQMQIQESSLRPTRITKIFITHAHGDHSFGLPGLLCLMGTNFDRNDQKRVEIYGPTGLRAYLRAAIHYTHSKAVCPYVVHELAEVPYLHGDFVPPPDPFHVDIALDARYGEQGGGRNFFPDKNGHYELFRDEKVKIRAAPMKHGVPCLGFAIEEADRPGRLLAEKLTPILNEHKAAIIETTGRRDVGWVLGWIKSTKRGESITLPGTNVTINSADYVGEIVKGRKLVILGDTCDAGSMVPLAMGADVVIHEATNTLLPPLDQGKTYADVEAEAIKHGHSTPMMAAAFAQRVGAKTLILNHFSARYRGDPSDASVAAMLRIERQAARAGGLERHQVIASWDLLELPVVDANTWEAARAGLRQADSAFEAELLRRARAWQEEEKFGRAAASAAAAASASAGDLSGASASVPDVRRFLEDGAADGESGSGTPGGERAAESNGSTNGSAAATSGLVGIMFDAVA